jgi:hypothetical protein
MTIYSPSFFCQGPSHLKIALQIARGLFSIKAFPARARALNLSGFIRTVWGGNKSKTAHSFSRYDFS